MLRRIAGSLLVLIGLGMFLYFSWAATRIGHAALTESQWPRAAPYPDRWLLALNDYYDARHPAGHGAIKLHGELDRVLRDVTWASRSGAALFLLGAILMLLPLLRRWNRERRRGFDVAPSAVSEEKRETSEASAMDERWQTPMSIVVETFPPMPTRPCRFCLSLQGGSVWADFDTDEDDAVWLRRISFDGYGSCHVRPDISRMSAAESALLLNAVARGEADTAEVQATLLRYFQENKDALWVDALAEHDLL